MERCGHYGLALFVQFSLFLPTHVFWLLRIVSLKLGLLLWSVFTGHTLEVFGLLW